MLRLHPSERRVRELAERTPARFVAFDLIWREGVDLRAAPFSERREALERALGTTPAAVAPTPITDDVDVARGWLAASHGTGIDGVVAKDPRGPYEPGKRAMIKVKAERTLDAVVAGYRWMMERPAIGSLGTSTGAGRPTAGPTGTRPPRAARSGLRTCGLQAMRIGADATLTLMEQHGQGHRSASRRP
jgi:ATP-dependent DNA ligase